ncbi:transmembrane anchored protein [Salmonella enterica]|nr:transmembrane anchored protein [Salmonella enterica]ECF8136067.1 transmembrane anchored protein [Salmonella enterica]
MKKVFLMLFTAISVFVSSPSFAGNCMHDNDRAADGSRCGGRSADSRPGGEGIR